MWTLFVAHSCSEIWLECRIYTHSKAVKRERDSYIALWKIILIIELNTSWVMRAVMESQDVKLASNVDPYAKKMYDKGLRMLLQCLSSPAACFRVEINNVGIITSVSKSSIRQKLNRDEIFFFVKKIGEAPKFGHTNMLSKVAEVVLQHYKRDVKYLRERAEKIFLLKNAKRENLEAIGWKSKHFIDLHLCNEAMLNTWGEIPVKVEEKKKKSRTPIKSNEEKVEEICAEFPKFEDLLNELKKDI